MNTIQDHDDKVAQTNELGIKIQTLLYQKSWYNARANYAASKGMFRAQDIYRRVLIFIEEELHPLVTLHTQYVREVLEFRRTYEINLNLSYNYYLKLVFIPIVFIILHFYAYKFIIFFIF
jgi:hypothetical protein